MLIFFSAMFLILLSGFGQLTSFLLALGAEPLSLLQAHEED
jgi:hypothetical protein